MSSANRMSLDKLREPISLIKSTNSSGPRMEHTRVYWSGYRIVITDSNTLGTIT